MANFITVSDIQGAIKRYLEKCPGVSKDRVVGEELIGVLVSDEEMLGFSSEDIIQAVDAYMTMRQQA